MSAHNILAFIGALVMASYVAYATDPTQLQDFCIGINDPNGAGNTSSIAYYVFLLHCKRYTKHYYTMFPFNY